MRKVKGDIRSWPRQIKDGEHVFYQFQDGMASVAVDNVWVSAMFESLEAAKSWKGHFFDAEKEFRRLNGGPRGEKLIGMKQQADGKLNKEQGNDHPKRESFL